MNLRGCDGRCRSACRPPGRYPIRTTSPVVIPLYSLSWTCHSKHYRPRGHLPPQKSGWYNPLHLLILSSPLISFCPVKLDCLLQAGETIAQKVAGEDDHKFRQIMQTKAVHLLAIFVLVYVGVEVTIGGRLFKILLRKCLISNNFRKRLDRDVYRSSS